MLQDIYGLFGVYKTDAELATLVDEYIQVAIFGEGQAKGLGSFQLVYGSDASANVATANGKNLKDEDVLRRQIEDYMKYRGPVIIVKQILDKIELFKTVKKDAEIIEEKIELDESLDDLYKTYKDLKSRIDDVNTYSAKEREAYAAVTDGMKKVKDMLSEMEPVRAAYTVAIDKGDTDRATDLEAHYEMLKANLKAYINGGDINRWVADYWDDEGEWNPGHETFVESYSSSANSKSLASKR
jgi:hypothetical protein